MPPAWLCASSSWLCEIVLCVCERERELLSRVVLESRSRELFYFRLFLLCFFLTGTPKVPLHLWCYLVNIYAILNILRTKTVTLQSQISSFLVLPAGLQGGPLRHEALRAAPPARPPSPPSASRKTHSASPALPSGPPLPPWPGPAPPWPASARAASTRAAPPA